MFTCCDVHCVGFRCFSEYLYVVLYGHIVYIYILNRIGVAIKYITRSVNVPISVWFYTTPYYHFQTKVTCTRAPAVRMCLLPTI